MKGWEINFRKIKDDLKHITFIYFLFTIYVLTGHRLGAWDLPFRGKGGIDSDSSTAQSNGYTRDQMYDERTKECRKWREEKKDQNHVRNMG